MPTETPKRSKHSAISEYLTRAISSGEFRAGERIPSEHKLVAMFGASRPTVARALRELQYSGLIERRTGSGTYVRQKQRTAGFIFGLLVPELGQTEIFEPICTQISRQAQAQGCTLMWGDYMAADDSVQANVERAERACRSYVEHGVSGVFFAPVEFTGDEGRTNYRILEQLHEAGIAVVLLDRDVATFPERSEYDLVGVDNLRGGFLVTQHLIGLGRKRIAFVARENSAATVDLRITGYREALLRAELLHSNKLVRFGDVRDAAFVRALMKQERPDAIICANDITAARLMQSLSELGVGVPEQLVVTGFDDVRYAHLLGVPLTTVHQPCAEIGSVAVSVMRERLANPSAPPRTVMLEPSLVVRRSCGALD